MKKPDSILELYTGSSVRALDDVESLKQHLPGGKFHYVDIAAEQMRDKSLKRWPLIAEHCITHKQPSSTEGTNLELGESDLKAVGIHGLREGVGATSVVAMVADALQRNGQSVLMIDLNPEDILRLHFNVPLRDSTGWAHAQLLNEPWNEHVLEITEHLYLLPFGRFGVKDQLRHTYPKDMFWLTQLANVKPLPHWVLFDMPQKLLDHPIISQLLDLNLMIASVDMDCHVLLLQTELQKNTRLLINKQDATRDLCKDLLLEWQRKYRDQMLPVILTRDESVHEAFALKSPVTQAFPTCIAALEANAMANWLTLHMGQKR